MELPIETNNFYFEGQYINSLTTFWNYSEFSGHLLMLQKIVMNVNGAERKVNLMKPIIKDMLSFYVKNVLIWRRMEKKKKMSIFILWYWLLVIFGATFAKDRD